MKLTKEEIENRRQECRKLYPAIYRSYEALGKHFGVSGPAAYHWLHPEKRGEYRSKHKVKKDEATKADTNREATTQNQDRGVDEETGTDLG